MKKEIMKKVLGACALSFCLGLFSFAPAQAAENGTTTAIVLSKYSDLDTKAVDANTGMITGSFKAKTGAELTKKEDVYKIVLPQDGYYRINLTGVFKGDEGITTDYDNNQVKFQLCSDAACMKPLTNMTTDGSSEDAFKELSAGTYYAKLEDIVNSEKRSVDSTYAVSFGYLPKDTQFISVSKTIDKAARKVTLQVSGLDAKTIKIKSGNKGTSGWELTGILWDGSDEIKNGGTYDITQPGNDGYYTIRMTDTYGHVYGLPVAVPEFDTPAAPVIREYVSGTNKISGTTVPEGVITVKAGNASYTTVAGTDGAWSVAVKMLKVNTVITAEVTSSFGVKCQNAATVKVANRRIASPKVKRVKKNAKKITGKAVKKAKVFAKIGKKTYKATVSAKGKFTIKVKKVKKGTRIKVYVKDATGNTSKTVTVKAK